MVLICRALLGADGKSVRYDSVEAKGSTIKQMIINDTSYGFLKPKNGKYYTVALKNTDDEISYSNSKKALIDGWWRWEVWTKTDFKWSLDFENADIKVEFRTEAEDSNLTTYTIAYMYYPVAGSMKGIMIVNKRFVYTNSGKSQSGQWMIDHGIQVQFPNGQYETIDLDKIFGHELGHGVFGLPHDSESGNTMSSTESSMSEFCSWRDLARAIAKAGRKIWPERQLYRIMRWWYHGASER